jgi:tetratricopeptide (TPR) repeat protein
MITVRWLRAALLALGTGLALVPGAIRAEPTKFPTDARVRFEQGQEFQDRGMLKQAIAAYDDAIRRGMKDYPRVHLFRANSYLGLKEYDTAIAQYTKFLQNFTLEDSCRL